ncbi:putative class III homeodomain-leucine zipper family [Helianthus debilis subsp. tardiflorus]
MAGLRVSFKEECVRLAWGDPVSYERAVAWKVVNEEENVHCLAFMFINWSFV